MSDLKKWYLGGMVAAADKAEFKEDEHPRGKGGMFVKKGEGGGGSSALEEVYRKGGFKHPEALAKADFEELGKMDDSRLDAEITMLKGKVEEGGKPLDKARLEAAEGIMKGRVEAEAQKNSDLQFKHPPNKSLEKMDDVALGKAMAEAINGKDKVRQHMIGEEQNRRYAEKVSKMDDKELDDAVKSNESLVKKYGSGDDNPYVKSLEIAKAEKAKRGEKSVKITSKEDYLEYAKKNFGDVFGKDIDSMSLKDLGRYREFLDWRVGLPSTAGGLHQTLRSDIEDLITEREKSLKK